MENDSPKLFYETSQEKAIQVSMAADPNRNILNKYVTIECPALSPPHASVEHPTSYSPCADNTVINIQLLYNPNAPMEPNLWDGNFHPILLHSSIEYLASDFKNIKDSLNFIAKYINNKQVDLARANDFEDLNNIREAIWNLISSVYRSK